LVEDETVVDSYLPELDSRLDWMRLGGEEGNQKESHLIHAKKETKKKKRVRVVDERVLIQQRMKE